MEGNNLNTNNQMNTNIENNKMDKGNNKNVLIALMAVVIVCLVGYIVYTKFIDKTPDKPKDDNTQEQGNNNPTPMPTNENENNNSDKFAEVELSSSNKEITVGNVVLSIKSSDNSLFINNNKIYTSEWEDGTHTGYNVYTNNKSEYALIEDTYENICGDGLIVGAINSKGEFVNVERKELSNHPDVPSCRGEIYLKNNKIYATYGGEYDETDFSYDVEFIIK